MGMIEDIEKAIKDGEIAVLEAEKGIRILKAAEEPTEKTEAELKLAKDKLAKIKAAVLKEKSKKD